MPIFKVPTRTDRPVYGIPSGLPQFRVHLQAFSDWVSSSCPHAKSPEELALAPSRPLMTTTSRTALLDSLLFDWRAKLQGWSLDGSLASAGQQALVLNGTPAALQDLISQWSAGDFRSLPPVVLISSVEMGGVMGAYGISTGTIYLNGDWLSTASRKQVQAVLTEELGHFLDGLLNATDTPGDEGESFSKLLFKSKADLTAIQQQNDAGTIAINGQPIAVELAASSITAPAGTSNLSSPNLSYTVNISGTNAGADLLVAAYASDGSLIGWQVVNRSTTFSSASTYNGTFNFASTAINKVDYTTISLRVWQGTAGSSYGTGNNTTPRITYGKTTTLANRARTGFTVNVTTAPTSTTGAINFSASTPTSGYSSVASNNTTVDTIAPAITASITDVKDDIGTIQGSVLTGARTDDYAPTIIGSYSASLKLDETIRVYNGSTELGQANIIDSIARTWSFTPSQALPSSTGTTYTITARVSDSNGNLGAASAARTFVLDTLSPSVGVLSLGSFTDSGISSSDRISSDNSFSINLSTRETGSTLAIERSTDNSIYTPTPTLQSGLIDGDYWFRAKVTDSAGNISYTNVISLTIDRTVGTGILSIKLPSGGRASTVALGNSFSLSVINNEVGSNIVYERSTNGTTWISTSQAQSNLALGKYFYRAKVTDVAGNTAYTLSQNISVVPGLLSGYSRSDYVDKAIIDDLAIPEKKPEQKLLTRRIGHDNFLLGYATAHDPIYLDGRLIDPSTYSGVGVRFKYKDKFSNYYATSETLFCNDDVFIGTPASDYIEYLSGNNLEYVSGYSFGLDGEDRLSAAFVNGGANNDAIRARIAFGGPGDDQIISSTQSKKLDTENPVDSILALSISKSIAHYLSGGDGNDAIFDQFSLSGWYYGGAGDDLIVGSPQYIKGNYSGGSAPKPIDEIDWLTGGLGADTFYLSGSSYFPTSSTQLKNSFTYLNGLSSYAIITDYSQNEGDTIQFHQPLKSVQQGTMSVLVPYTVDELFSLSQINYDGADAVGIYLKIMPQNSGPSDAIGSTPDLIAVVEGATLSNFGLSNIALENLSFVRQTGWTNYI